MQKWERQQARDKQKLQPPEPLHIALEDYDLSFYQYEVDQAKELWKAGVPMKDIAEQMNREQIEIFCLLYEFAEAGKVKPRTGGIYGVMQ